MKVCAVIAAASAGERIKKQGFCSCLAYLASWAMSKSFQNYAICSREYAKLMKPEFLQLNPRVDPRIHSWTKWGFRFQEWVTKNLGGPILKHVVFQWQMPATLPPIWPTTTQHGGSAITGTLNYKGSWIFAYIHKHIVYVEYWQDVGIQAHERHVCRAAYLPHSTYS